MTTATRTEHPYVTHDRGICGGSPIVAGRRIPVWQIAVLLRQGAAAEDIAAEYAGRLTPAAIYDAISYYYDHAEEIEADVRRNTDEAFLDQRLEQLDATHGSRGTIHYRKPAWPLP
jgi:uncharacterized protein (DUF433 family)